MGLLEDYKFQSTLPRGERPLAQKVVSLSALFQSTLPRGERLSSSFVGVNLSNISIHAPARGATKSFNIKIINDTHFNPRSREGSDVRSRLTLHHKSKFQSTLPRGERPKYCSFRCSPSAFQSTLPRGERQRMRWGCSKTINFNPRSREGSDSITFDFAP